MREEGLQLRVMGATLASVAIHVGLAWVMAVSTFGIPPQRSANQADTSLVIPLASAAPPPAEKAPAPEPKPEPPKVAEVTPPPPPPPAEKAPPEVTPGIDNSKAQTQAWVGFAEATEQKARKSEVDQSAMSPQPGLPAQVQVPAPPPQAQAQNAPPAPAEPDVPAPDPAEQRAPAGGGAAAQTPAAPSKPPAEQAPADAKEADRPPDAKTAPQQMTPGPEADAKGVKGLEGGAADATPRETPPEKGVEGGTQPEPGAAKATKAAQADAKDEQGEKPATPDAKGEIADAAQDEVKGAKAHDELGVLPEAKPAQRLAQAAPAQAQAPLGDALAQEVGPPVPEWLRQAAAAAQPPAAASQPGRPGPQAPNPEHASAAPKPLPAAGAPAAGDTPGLKSDSESIASSTFEVTSLQFGKVLARQGLKIRTVRPRFSLTTMLVASPRDATIEIVFGRDGSVIRAQFGKGETTGSQEIDDVLLRSTYRWEAAGQELERIPPGKPDAGLTVKIRFILR
ncbi:MAG: hypothetical protein GC200_07265 [Tepidisphaera sp.]|nr:hypothetical protein [Tepidisphaera sp.]